jgi:5'(3')-deoxyribonucleotidase
MIKDKKRVLVDCDGILADFMTPCIDFINERTGMSHTVDEVRGWNAFECLKYEYLEAQFFDLVTRGGWCSGMIPYSGAQDGLRRLSLEAEVVIVTSPMQSLPWALERTQWLKRYFNVPHERIVMTRTKRYVSGDFIIDDLAENCADWLSGNLSGTALLWTRPWNEDNEFAMTVGTKRVSDWDQIIQEVTT